MFLKNHILLCGGGGSWRRELHGLFKERRVISPPGGKRFGVMVIGAKKDGTNLRQKMDSARIYRAGVGQHHGHWSRKAWK